MSLLKIDTDLREVNDRIRPTDNPVLTAMMRGAARQRGSVADGAGFDNKAPHLSDA